nr:hypothetical protein [uncultured Sphingobacterium sp.]
MKGNVNRSVVEVWVLLGIAVIAGFSTVLRPSIDSKLTLFRILLPFIVGFFIYKRPMEMLTVLWISMVLFIYNYFVSIYISRFHNFDLTFYFYSVILVFWYYFVKYIVEVGSVLKTYKFLVYVFKAMIILGFVQLFFGGQYPNTPIRPSEIIIFFYNGNEFAAVLAAFLPLYFLSEKVKTKYLWISGALFFMIYNDARLCLISMLLFFLSYVIIKIPVFNKGKLGLFLMVFTLLTSIFLLKDYEVLPGIVINDLVLDPLNHIINLEAVEHVGSINSRINAVIFGTKELIGSYFWGIGLGNSHLMIAEHLFSENRDWAAHSMHNFVYQIITELGWLGMIYLFLIFKIVKRGIQENTSNHKSIMWIYYVSLTLTITMLSGPFSNYFFLFIFYYSIFHFKYDV